METYAIMAEWSALAVSTRRILRGQGTFRHITGTVTVAENELPQSLQVSIDARSLQTGLSVRDQHLKTATFMDAGRYPLITYASKRIQQFGADRYTILGRLRLHGQEHPVTLEAWLEPADDTDGARRVHFTGTVSSSAFAIPRNPLLRTMVWAMFSDAVAVTGSVCLVSAREVSQRSRRLTEASCHKADASTLTRYVPECMAGVYRAGPLPANGVTMSPTMTRRTER